MMKKGAGCCAAKCGKWLVVIGAINWGLVGAGMFAGGSDWNLVSWLVGNWPWLEALVYVLVGLAGLGMLFGCKCKKCKGGDCGNCGNCGSCKPKMESHGEQEHHEHQEHH